VKWWGPQAWSEIYRKCLFSIRDVFTTPAQNWLVEFTIHSQEVHIFRPSRRMLSNFANTNHETVLMWRV
jgi:hypothetical protein